MTSAITSALSSLQSASRQVDATATKIAGGGGDLIEDAVTLKLAQAQFSASLSIIKAQADADKQLARLFDETV